MGIREIPISFTIVHLTMLYLQAFHHRIKRRHFVTDSCEVTSISEKGGWCMRALLKYFIEVMAF